MMNLHRGEVAISGGLGFVDLAGAGGSSAKSRKG
jgi:hypothetical protein